MKAIIKTGPVPGLEYADMPDPRPGADEVMIRVEAASICGTDIHYNRWDAMAENFREKFGMAFPLVIGHECAGEVVEVGTGVKTVKVGDRVSFETHIPCGRCYQCQNGSPHNCADMGIYGCSCPGCFADYALAPASVCFRLPDGVSYEEGALFEPAGVSMRAIEEAAVLPGDTVVVYGCGPIGLMTIHMLQVCGAACVIGIDVDEYRLGLAKKYGAVTINAAKEDPVKRVLELTRERRGADVIIELTGNAKVYENLFDMFRLEGRFVSIGHPLSPVTIDVTKMMNFKGILWKGVFGRRIWYTWWKLAAMVAAKKFDILDVVTHRFAFADFQAAFDQIDKGAGKILFVRK